MKAAIGPSANLDQAISNRPHMTDHDRPVHCSGCDGLFGESHMLEQVGFGVQAQAQHSPRVAERSAQTQDVIG